MHDPLPSPPLAVRELIEPLAERLHLYTLPLHAHEIVGAFLFYQGMYVFVSPFLSSWLLPQTYRPLPGRTKVNWNVRTVSFVQSTLISIVTLYVIAKDAELKEVTWKERLWGYTGAAGMVQAFAAGYFTWDLLVSSTNLAILGPGSLAHAIFALLITCLGFRPFANYYGLRFVLYELSTPFLNVHWFLDKLNMTGSRLQLWNGICLIVVFFGCRIAWGFYVSAKLYLDAWSAWKESAVTQNTQGTAQLQMKTALFSEGSKVPTASAVPIWLLVAYLVSNTSLSLLNCYWFGKMISTVRARFEPKEKDAPKKKL